MQPWKHSLSRGNNLLLPHPGGDLKEFLLVVSRIAEAHEAGLLLKAHRFII